MSDERSVPELGRLLDDVRRDYLRKDWLEVYRAERDDDRRRITRLENEETSKTSGSRNWMLGVAQTIVGVILTTIATVLIVRGGR